MLWKSSAELDRPNLAAMPIEAPFGSPEAMGKYKPPADACGILLVLLHPAARGKVSLSGSRPEDPPILETDYLSDSRDTKIAQAGLEFCLEVASKQSFSKHVTRAVTPMGKADLLSLIKENALGFLHPCCTASMGTDDSSVVNERLQVHGVEGLRIADASVLPDITTGNTMAPCVVVGERAAHFLRHDHGL